MQIGVEGGEGGGAGTGRSPGAGARQHSTAKACKGIPVPQHRPPTAFPTARNRPPPHRFHIPRTALRPPSDCPDGPPVPFKQSPGRALWQAYPVYHRHPPRATAWHPLSGTDLQRGVGRGGGRCKSVCEIRRAKPHCQSQNPVLVMRCVSPCSAS